MSINLGCPWSDFGPLGQGQSVFDIDAEMADRALDPRVPEQDLPITR